MDPTLARISLADRKYIDTLRSRLEDLESKTPLEEQDIDLFIEDQLAILRLRSAASKNALSGKMISKLTDRLDELHELAGQGQIKALLIEGCGGTFCSGSDLVCVRELANQEAGLWLAAVMQFNLMRLQQLPLVSVALVQGYALGGGAELAVGADLRLMSPGAKIGFVHVKVGVCCGWGGGSRLVGLVGPSRALDLLATGRLVEAHEATQLGLANAVVRDRQQALDYISARMVGHCNTIGAIKSMINSARLLPSLPAEASLFASTWGRPEHLQALDQNLKHKQ